MLYQNMQVNKHLLRVGELVEQSLVSPELLGVVLTGLDRELSVICAVEDACSVQLRCGEDGT
jgi:hypothetical protein